MGSAEGPALFENEGLKGYPVIIAKYLLPWRVRTKWEPLVTLQFKNTSLRRLCRPFRRNKVAILTTVESTTAE
jgi:hypothetical protein